MQSVTVNTTAPVAGVPIAGERRIVQRFDGLLAVRGRIVSRRREGSGQPDAQSSARRPREARFHLHLQDPADCIAAKSAWRATTARSSTTAASSPLEVDQAIPVAIVKSRAAGNSLSRRFLLSGKGLGRRPVGRRSHSRRRAHRRRFGERAAGQLQGDFPRQSARPECRRRRAACEATSKAAGI